MRELDFLPPWYLQLNRERLLLRRTITVCVLAVFTIFALQGAASWLLSERRVELQQLQQKSARAAATLSREHALTLRRDRLRAEYLAWNRAAAPVSAVALSRKLDALVPGHVTLTGLKLGDAAVHLSGVAEDDVDVAALLLSLNGERSFDQVRLANVKEQKLQGQSVRRFDVSFVAAADASEALP